jgi:hypothetical protein
MLVVWIWLERGPGDMEVPGVLYLRESHALISWITLVVPEAEVITWDGDTRKSKLAS